MCMLFNTMNRSKKNRANKFFVSELCYAQTIDILKTRSQPLGIELVIGDYNTVELTDEFFGIILQYPKIWRSFRLLQIAKIKRLRY